jgi:hypothetical protein
LPYLRLDKAMGWLIWNAMRLLALIGFVLFTTTIVLFVWFMFDVGFAWVGIVVIALALLLVFFTIKNRGTGFDIRR